MAHYSGIQCPEFLLCNGVVDSFLEFSQKQQAFLYSMVDHYLILCNRLIEVTKQAIEKNRALSHCEFTQCLTWHIVLVQ